MRTSYPSLSSKQAARVYAVLFLLDSLEGDRASADSLLSLSLSLGRSQTGRERLWQLDCPLRLVKRRWGLGIGYDKEDEAFYRA